MWKTNKTSSLVVVTLTSLTSLSLSFVGPQKLWAETTPDPIFEITSALGSDPNGLSAEDVMELSLYSPASVHSEAVYEKSHRDSKSAYQLFVPRIDGRLSYRRQSSLQAYIPQGSEQFIKNPLDAYSAKASVSIPVSQYILSILPKYQSVISKEEMAQATKQAEFEATALKALETYFSLLTAKVDAVLSEKSVEVLTKQMQDIDAMVRAGSRSNVDLLQIRAQLAAAKVTQSQAQGRVAALQENISRLLNRSKIDPAAKLLDTTLLNSDLQLESTSKEQWIQEAMTKRPEVKSLVAGIRMNNKLQAQYLGDAFPKFTVDGEAEYAQPNPRTFYKVDQFIGTWFIGLNLVWSPNDAVLALSNRGKAKEDVITAEADLKATQNTVAVEVTEAIAQYQAANQAIISAEEGVRAASGAFRDRQALLRSGGGTVREALLAEQDLRSAQKTWLASQLDLRYSEALVRRALGRLSLVKEKQD